jgi:hypothetical protein
LEPPENAIRNPVFDDPITVLIPVPKKLPEFSTAPSKLNNEYGKGTFF